jgi:hypothetical protein
MVTKKALNMWQNKLSESILTVAGGLRFGLSLNPNSQIYQDAYDKAMYSLSIIAGEVDIMFPNPIEYKFVEEE